MTSRYLGIDYGEKRIGLALSDPLGMTAQPLKTLINDATTLSHIQDVVSEYAVGAIILGLPLHQNGSETPKSQHVRTFHESLTKVLDIPIHFQDERYSTKAAERHLISADVSRKNRKKVIDQQAAVFFLQGYLDTVG